jgi:hypothetical protein
MRKLLSSRSLAVNYLYYFPLLVIKKMHGFLDQADIGLKAEFAI